jgi:outer membrane receptor for ferrienterochelin and colicin
METRTTTFLNVTLGLLLTLMSSVVFSQNRSVDEAIKTKLNRTEALMNEHKYDAALDEVNEIYSTQFDVASFANKEHILNLLIRLTFIIDNRVQTKAYIEEYYKIDPDFSAKSIEQATPQLIAFINKYVKESNEDFVFVNKHKQDVNLIPSTVTVYRQEDIELLGARNLLDLLRLTPGFAELGDNNERVVGVRGTSSTSVQDILFLINGHRITDILTNTTAPDWIDLEYVEQIEIVRGPGSALYGGTAFSGVVNIITKTAKEEDISILKVVTGNGNSLSTLQGDVNSYKVNYQFSKRISNKEGFYFSGTYHQSGGSEIDYSKDSYPDKAIVRDMESATDSTTVRKAALYDKEYINKYGPSYNVLFNYSKYSLQVTANAQSSMFVYSRANSLNLWNSQDKDSLRGLRRRVDKREFIQVSYDLLNNSKNKDKLLIKVAGDHFKKDFLTNNYSFGIEESTKLIGDEYRGTVSLEYSTDSILNGNKNTNNHFLLGFESYVNNWDYRYFKEDNDTFKLQKVGDFFSEPGQSQSEYVAAVYFQNERDIVKDKLIGTIGLRLNYHSKYSKFEDGLNYGEQYSPRFALVYLPKGKAKAGIVNFKLMYNSAFTPPPFLYRKGGISGFEGSEDLNPMKIESGEFVVFGTLNKYFTYSSQVYINKIDNYIYRKDSIASTTGADSSYYTNELTERIHYGIEAELRFKNQKVSERLILGGFINLSTVGMTHLPGEADSYLDVFDKSIYDNNSLVLFPGMKSNLAFYGIYSFSKQARIKKMSFGFNVEYIGESTIYSEYQPIPDGDGEWTETEGAFNRQTIREAVLLSARVKAHTKNFNISLSSQNMTNKGYDLPTAIYKTKRKRGEGRMIYLTLEFNLAKSGKNESL